LKKLNVHFVLIVIVFALFLAGCSGGVPSSSSFNFSGNWTMTNSTLSSTLAMSDIGSTTTAKCNIVDTNGSLTIYNFRLVNQEFMKWNTGYGSRIGNKLTGNVNGSYTNIYGDPVSMTIYFEGTINKDGISGSGYWTQTFNVYGYFDTSSGVTIFVKG
jgi:hypothetical protein